MIVFCPALKPGRRARMIRSPAGTLVTLNSPFCPVSAPDPVPLTVTCASDTGRCDLASVTLPRTVPDRCATGEPTGAGHARAADAGMELNVAALRELDRARSRPGRPR